MRRLLPVLLAAGALAGGCQFPQFGGPKAKDSSPRSDAGLRPEKGFRKKANTSATPDQLAVFTFLDEDKQRFQTATAGLTKLSKPSAVSTAISKYLEQSDAADQAALPAEFKETVVPYLDAHRKLVAALVRLPDGSYDGTKFYDQLAALFRGDFDAGKPLGGDVADSVKAARESAAAMFKAAAQYGLDVDR
jgi:hypothetical protein